MYRKILVLAATLFLTLIVCGNVWSDVVDHGGAIMRPDHDTLRRWIADYEKAPKAPIDEAIKSRISVMQAENVSTSLDLLSHVPYQGSQRNQGNCGNCWVWAGTGLMEIALSVQNSVNDRLSIQYLDSCKTDDFACNGGNLDDFAGWYGDQGRTLPWSNTNASYADGSVTSSQTSSSRVCGTIGTSPNYPLDGFTPQTIATTGSTTQAQAISNIKNVLNQNKGVWFAFWLPNSTAWSAFDTFWSGSAESALWNPDTYCGYTYDSTGGGHAVIIVGYNDDDSNSDNHYWTVLNSWGVTSGRTTGLFRMKMNMNYSCMLHEIGGDFYNNQFQTIGINYETGPPSINANYPVDNATGVDTGTTITVTFNKAMNATTINSTNFYLNNGVTGSVSYNSTTKTAILIPSASLAPYTVYTATVTTNVTDEAGNHLAAAKTWNFTTGDGTSLIANDSFENDMTGWATAQVSGTSGAWTTVSSGSHPSTVPHGGAKMALFNSYDVSIGSQTRLYQTSGFAIPSSSVTSSLSFWMYHDTGYSANADQLQVQVSTDGSTWTNVGSPVMRYDGTTGWSLVTLDLSAYKGQSNVRVGFLGKSYYGNDINLDDVKATFTRTLSLSMNFAGSGSGTVTINPLSISCNVNCSNQIVGGTPLTLHATPGDYSTFSGWSGDCSGAGDCALAMNADKNVTSTFTLTSLLPVHVVGGGCYDSFQLAYISGAASCTIMAKAVELSTLDFTLNNGKTVTLEGGYDGTYSVNNGYTTLQGILTLGTGSLTVENLIIK
jgi:hypothetical protein